MDAGDAGNLFAARRAKTSAQHANAWVFAEWRVAAQAPFG